MKVNRPGVWMWLLDDLMRIDQNIDDLEAAEREYSWERRTYVTDVVNSSHIPPRGAILVGYTGADQPIVRALGCVSGIAGTATGRVRVTVRPLLHLGTLRLSEVASEAGIAEGHRPLIAQSLRPRLIEAKPAADILAVLQRLRPEVGPWLERVSQEAVPIRGDAGQQLREERDAIQTGMDLAGVELPEVPFVAGAGIVQATEMLNPAMFVDNEDDLIFADLRRFDETGHLEEVSASTSVYREDEFEIHIANVNRKPLEHQLGVDLLYWDRIADSYTLVQYKRLVRNSKLGGDESEGQVAIHAQGRARRATRQDEQPRALCPDQCTGLAHRGQPILVQVRTDEVVRSFRFASASRDVRTIGKPQARHQFRFIRRTKGRLRDQLFEHAVLATGSVRRAYPSRILGTTSAGSAEVARLLATLSESHEIVVVTKSSPVRA